MHSRFTESIQRSAMAFVRCLVADLDHLNARVRDDALELIGEALVPAVNQ